jgi:BUD22
MMLPMMKRDGSDNDDHVVNVGEKGHDVAAAASAACAGSTKVASTEEQQKKKKIPSRKTKLQNRKRRRLKDDDDDNENNGNMMMSKSTISTRKEKVALALKMDRYSKLFHQAQKQLTKQAKQVRTFLVQRQIRKLKNNDKNSSIIINNNNNNTTTTAARIDPQEPIQQDQHHQHPSLQPLKDLSLDLVIQQAMRQLGLIQANPNPDAAGTTDCAQRQKQVQVLDRSSSVGQLVSKILDHKSFQQALEEWNEKVAEFRRFCLQLDEKNDPLLMATGTPAKRKKGQQRPATKTTSLRAPSSSHQQQPTSFFCSSLNDTMLPDDEGQPTGNGSKLEHYGPAATSDDFNNNNNNIPIKKNRQGQRARKAKALAIQAKKDGMKKQYYQSLNWREEKTAKTSDKHKKQQRPQRHTEDAVRKTAAALPAAAAATSEDLSKNHPSWAAKQQQKPTIVAFQGKKITFD